jgi:hypothetical protein
MQDEAQTETPPVCRTLQDLGAQIIQFFKLRTSRKSPPTVNGSQLTIFKSMA